MFQGGPYTSIDWLGSVPPILWTVTRLQVNGQWRLILEAYHRLPKGAFGGGWLRWSRLFRCQ
jgi:hypothetical protein